MIFVCTKFHKLLMAIIFQKVISNIITAPELLANLMELAESQDMVPNRDPEQHAVTSFELAESQDEEQTQSPEQHAVTSLTSSSQVQATSPMPPVEADAPICRCGVPAAR